MSARHFTVVDFETASVCDLKVAGAWRYSEDPTTEILTLRGRDPDTGAVRWGWHPGEDTGPLLALVANPNEIFIAHNTNFERAIWANIMQPIFQVPEPPDNRWHDTMAVCAMKAIPQQLEKAAHVLGLPVEKDMAGSRFTIGLSKPNKAGYFLRTPEALARVDTYCDTDCDAEAALHKRIGFLSKAEHEVWKLDQRINRRGVALDLDFISAANRIVKDASAVLVDRFQALTGYSPGQNAKVLEWCADHGARLPNLQKETIAAALGGDLDETEVEEEWTGAPLSPEAREALWIRSVVGSASVKKLGRMGACVAGDGRVRGVVQYHGAGTGRWAGRLFQPQNFPRPTLKDEMGQGMPMDRLVAAIMTGDYQYVEALMGAPAIEVVVSSLRHAVVSGPGYELAVGDFAGIEARVVLAAAGQHDKCALIAGGLDPYCDFASVVLKRPINKKEHPDIRQRTGKPGVLGCGFGMGKDKLARKEGISLEAATDIVNTYRKDWAPNVPKFWYGLEAAATKTVWDGTPHEHEGFCYALEDGWLTCRMPSTRKLWYWSPRPVRRAMPWDDTDIRRGFTYLAYKNGRMKTVHAYGGLLTENVVQALARDLMVDAMFKCEDNGIPIVLTVHDEIIGEPEHGDAPALKQIMEDRPRWAVEMSIPVEAETWTGPRYGKR